MNRVANAAPLAAAMANPAFSAFERQGLGIARAGTTTMPPMDEIGPWLGTSGLLGARN